MNLITEEEFRAFINKLVDDARIKQLEEEVAVLKRKVNLLLVETDNE